MDEGLTHTVSQGECVASIAAQYGFHPDTVWNSPGNAGLRELRKEQHILKPGDSLEIPPKTPKYEMRSTDLRHRFVRKGVPEILTVQFFLNDEPRAAAKFDVVIDGSKSAGVTDGNGVARIKIAPQAKRATLTFEGTNDQFILELGFMNPATEISGIKGRLLSLGFYHGPVDNEDGPALADAIQDFQEFVGLKATGELDDSTRRAIVDCYGE